MFLEGIILFFAALAILGFVIDTVSKANKEHVNSYEYKKSKIHKYRQQYLELYNKYNREVIKNYAPFIEYFKTLHQYYKNGGRKLENWELNKYFSYPKVWYLNEKNEFFVNGINLGDVKKCSLIGYKRGFNLGMSLRYKTIADVEINGNLDFVKSGSKVIERFETGEDFYNYSIEYNDWSKNRWTIARAENSIVYKNERIHKLEDHYHKYEGIIKKYITPELKAVYDDIRNNNYSYDEMDEKLTEYYTESELTWLKNVGEDKKKELDFNKEIGKKAIELDGTLYTYDQKERGFRYGKDMTAFEFIDLNKKEKEEYIQSHSLEDK